MTNASIPTFAAFRVALASSCLCFAASAEAIDELHRKYVCTACHADTKKLIGPGYQDVADRYRAQYQRDPVVTIDKLTLKVGRGGAGAWGQLPMPPHGHVPEADVRKMVKSVLEMPAKK